MDPLSWAYLIMAIVSTYAAQDAADTQTKAIERASALKENDRKRQEDEAFRQGAALQNEHARQGASDMALFDVMAGEFGGGRSIERARAVGELQADERTATLGNDSRLALTRLGFDGLANKAQSDSQLSAINRPSLLSSAMTIGSAYLGDKRYRDHVYINGEHINDYHARRKFEDENSIQYDAHFYRQGRPGG